MRLKRAYSKLEKEMDLKKFLMRQRMHTTAILKLLSGRQTFFVTNMSHQLSITDGDEPSS